MYPEWATHPSLDPEQGRGAWWYKYSSWEAPAREAALRVPVPLFQGAPSCLLSSLAVISSCPVPPGKPYSVPGPLLLCHLLFPLCWWQSHVCACLPCGLENRVGAQDTWVSSGGSEQPSWGLGLLVDPG